MEGAFILSELKGSKGCSSRVHVGMLNRKNTVFMKSYLSIISNICKENLEKFGTMNYNNRIIQLMLFTVYS